MVYVLKLVWMAPNPSSRNIEGISQDMGECEMMSAREQENEEYHRLHLEECDKSNKEHLEELERKRILSEKTKDVALVNFWERKRINTQKLRDKAQQ